MGEVFKINRTLPYNLRTHNEFSSRVPKTVNYETETISFLAAKVWALLPEKIKEYSCLKARKWNQDTEIRKWKPDRFVLDWFGLGINSSSFAVTLFIVIYIVNFNCYYRE